MAQAARATRNFKDYQSELRSKLSNSQLQKFKNLKTIEEKITFINGLENCPMYPISTQVNRGKNLEEAGKLKEQGNGCFQKEKYNDACWYYSQSILRAPYNCSEFPVFFANRSAALYHLKEYTLALKDIDFALSNNYPKNLQYKLLDRKARCLLALEKFWQACEAFKKTIQTLDDAKLPTDKRQKWQKDIQIMLIMLSRDGSSKKEDIQQPKITKSELDEIKKNTNSKYEALVSGIDVKYSSNMGRYAEAKQDIKAGRIILAEDPHCAVLLQKYQYTHCYNCFKRVKTLHPCPSCDQVIFCSLNCTITAMKYHKIECPVLSTLWESEISITCHISFRIIAQHELNYFLAKKDLQKTQPKEITHYGSSDYGTVFNLVTHEDRRKPEDMLNRIHMALFLLKCLKSGGYFKNDTTNEKLSKEEIFITKLLLRHLQVSQFNSHEVSELRIKNHDLINSSSEFIGGAIYPTLALFNHSCSPGVIRYFDGTKVITRTIRNIKKGEMIAENYGPIFTEMEKNDRQRVLKEQYWFDCNCEACTDNWPTMSNMLNEGNIRLRCTNNACRSLILVNQNNENFVAKCKKCSESTNILKALKSLQETDEKFKMAQTLMKLEKVDAILDITLPILRLLEEILVPPFKDYYLCAQIVRTCFLTKGNIYLESG